MKFNEVLLCKFNVEILDGDRGKNYPSKNEFTSDGHTLFLNNKNVISNKLDTSLGDYISVERSNLLRKGKLEREDIVLTTRGSIGNVGFYSNDIPQEHIRINSGMVIIRNQDSRIYTPFLYLLLRSNYAKEQYDKLSSGSVQKQLPIRDLKFLNVLDIPYDQQNQIWSIINTLDTKIELNNQIISSLEEFASTLFKRWFVDFEFPDENGNPYKSSGGKMVKSELGEIPEGFSVQPLNEICQVKDGTHDSPKSIPEGYPLVTSKHLKKNYIDFSTTNFISKVDFAQINKRSLVENGDILISMIGTVGRLYLVNEDTPMYAIKNIGLFKTSQVKKINLFIYEFLKSERIAEHIKSRMAGSTQQYISLTELRRIPLMLPHTKLLQNFIEKIDKTNKMIFSLTSQNEFLTELRDTLLPKLLSGEIEIRQSEDV